VVVGGVGQVGRGGIQNPDGSVVIASNPPVVCFYATGDGGDRPFGPIP